MTLDPLTNLAHEFIDFLTAKNEPYKDIQKAMDAFLTIYHEVFGK